MNVGIFLAGVGIFLWCLTQVILDLEFFLKSYPGLAY